ncbi:MAG: hypothetical protein J5I65_07620 [Aridibacter famidurans]|nr:hypothetical protein [Aridibacter famidurans]
MKTGELTDIVVSLRLMNSVSPRVGRTHIHKFLYLAEGWRLLQPRHEFELYLHGPYSRELDSEIAALQGVGVILAEADPAGYGARHSLQEPYSSLEAIDLVGEDAARGLRALAQGMATKTVRSLEAIATAEYVRRTFGVSELPQVRDAVINLKPHLSKEEVERAILELDALRRDVGV